MNKTIDVENKANIEICCFVDNFILIVNCSSKYAITSNNYISLRDAFYEIGKIWISWQTYKGTWIHNHPIYKQRFLLPGKPTSL